MWSDTDDDVVPVLFSIIETIEQIERKSREWWVHPYNKKRDAEGTIKKLMADLRKHPSKFKDFMRMEIETFDYLLGLIEESIAKQNTNYRKSITPAERLFITLRYMATGDTYQSLSHQFRCGSCTIGSIVMETCKAIWEILTPIYLPTPDVKKWTSVADAFQKMWNFPNCLGALGGTDIKMQCPPRTGTEYCKKKCIHLQAIVDAYGQFISVDVDDLKSMCDSGVLKHSNLGKQITNREFSLPHQEKLSPESDVHVSFVFVADEGYPLLTNVMRPFARKNLTNERKIYNYRLTRARRVIECAFSMLTKKFCILNTLFLLPPNKVQTITLTACVLHNMIREREDLLKEIYVERDAMEDAVQTNKNNQNARPSNAARLIRNHFVSYFNSATGSVPWQFKYAN